MGNGNIIKIFMKIVSCINVNTGITIADRLIIADNFIHRMIGLLGKKELKEREGIILKPCNSIHTFFMKFPIDVIFLDKDNIVINLIENMIPGKISPIIWKSKSILELPILTIKRTNTLLGHRLEMISL